MEVQMAQATAQRQTEARTEMPKPQGGQAQVDTKQAEKEFDGKAYLAKFPSKSAAIRKLAEEGYTRGQISRMLDIRYQHVRNVLIVPVAKPRDNTEGKAAPSTEGVEPQGSTETGKKVS
jgi:hypothetical protein